MQQNRLGNSNLCRGGWPAEVRGSATSVWSSTGSVDTLYVYTLEEAANRGFGEETLDVLRCCVSAESTAKAKEIYCTQLSLDVRRQLVEARNAAKARFSAGGVLPVAPLKTGVKRKAEAAAAEGLFVHRIAPLEMAVHALTGDWAVSEKAGLQIASALVDWSVLVNGRDSVFFSAVNSALGTELYTAVTRRIRESAGEMESYGRADEILDDYDRVARQMSDPDARHAMASPLFLLRCHDALAQRGMPLHGLRARLVGLSVCRGPHFDLNGHDDVSAVLGPCVLALLLSQSLRVEQSPAMTAAESEELEHAPAARDLPTAEQLLAAMSREHYAPTSRKNQSHPQRLAKLVHPAIVVGALRASPTLREHWRVVESAELAATLASATEKSVGRMWVELCDDLHDFLTKAEHVALTRYLHAVLSFLGAGLARQRRLLAFVDAVEHGADVEAVDLPCDALHEFDPGAVSRLRALCVESLRAECARRASVVASFGRSDDCVPAAACEQAAVVLEAQAFAHRAPNNSLLDYNGMLSICKVSIRAGGVDSIVCATGPMLLTRAHP